jgi:hypothetical protein
MHVISLPQHVGWIGDKVVDLHPWGSRINPYDWPGLWSTLNVDQIFSTYITNIA